MELKTHFQFHFTESLMVTYKVTQWHLWPALLTLEPPQLYIISKNNIIVNIYVDCLVG